MGLLDPVPTVLYDEGVTLRHRALVRRLLPLSAALVGLIAAPHARGQEGDAPHPLPADTGPAISVHTVPATAPNPADAAGTVELYRLRIVNRTYGAIQVSIDSGQSWRLIGRVLVPATSAAEGYIAAGYAPQGTVAATAVHGHRIRVSAPDPNLHAPLVISIDPREYADQSSLPDSYGGHRPGVSGIYTDIPAGTSIFRDLAPITGNSVYLESQSGRLFALPPTFLPTGGGETLVIPVLAPRNPLVQVTFENRAGGKVEGTFADGTVRPITQVVMPVQGIGRFDGTSYTGVGRLNTAHTGVITVSTAPVDSTAQPEGLGKERRGGFQIEPVWHNARTEEAGAPMVMALGTYGQPRHRELEGQPPLFRDMVSLGETAAQHGTNLEASLADMSVDGGPWEPLPTATGSIPDLFTGPGLTRYWKANGLSRVSTKGVTSFRLRLPQRDAAEGQRIALAVADGYERQELAKAKAGAMPIVHGVLTINANPTNAAGVAMVRFSIEGEPRGFSNVAPFSLSWDTRRVSDGEYLVEAEALSDAGSLVTASHKRVFVLNHKATASSTASLR